MGGDLPVYTFWPHGLDVGGGVWGGGSHNITQQLLSEVVVKATTCDGDIN